ncbi:MAG: diaminopimelate decarboxylase [Oscillospiraceae bacterium]|nr:diaminopimelate decarboxylase [Oscillospiraceae bacterium]
MFVSECLTVNQQDHLQISSCDTVALAQEYGTPLYVMSGDQIRQNCRMFCRSMEKFYAGKGMVLYASKAFSCKEIYRIMREEGMGLDVVSGGELYTALSVGFPAEKIYFHGNNKTPDELTYAIRSNVGRIVVDNLTELETLSALSVAEGKTAQILFRIKPGIDAHTHDFIRTGQIDSKFGLALENGEAFEAVKAAQTYPNISLTGLHCHIGSQIFDIEPFCHAAEVMIDFLGKIKAELGLELPELNLGGGFGIKYLSDHDPTPYDQYMEQVSAAVKSSCEKNHIAQPFILIEPGRSIVGAAGITLYTVGGVKEIKGIRTYVSVDGGMADNPRYALYNAPYEALIANKATQPKNLIATIAGKCCESGDLIQEHTAIQQTNPGDILAVLSTGAYNYSMSSNYNRIPRPAVVLAEEGKSRVIVRRETYEDLIKNDL